MVSFVAVGNKPASYANLNLSISDTDTSLYECECLLLNFRFLIEFFTATCRLQVAVRNITDLLHEERNFDLRQFQMIHNGNTLIF